MPNQKYCNQCNKNISSPNWAKHQKICNPDKSRTPTKICPKCNRKYNMEYFTYKHKDTCSAQSSTLPPQPSTSGLKRKHEAPVNAGPAKQPL